MEYFSKYLKGYGRTRTPPSKVSALVSHISPKGHEVKYLKKYKEETGTSLYGLVLSTNCTTKVGPSIESPRTQFTDSEDKVKKEPKE